MQHSWRAATAPLLCTMLWLTIACTPAAGPAADRSPTPASPRPAAPAPSGRPELPTTPRVALKAGTLPMSAYAPHFIARERGYFDEVGLDVEFASASNVNELFPAITQGQIQVGSCSNSVGCFNVMNRRTDLQVVADLASTTGPNSRSDSTALVVRKDLWDAGTIREPRDLIGRQIYTIAGEGSGAHATTAHWLLAKGIDPRSVEWPQMLPPDVLAAMTNRGIEVGVQYEPLLTFGLNRDIHAVLATYQEMNRSAYSSYLMYHRSIERMGPLVGERFMVAFLRGLRDYLNAMEYGIDQDAIIAIMIQETVLKDPAVYRQARYSWADPNGVLDPAALQADAELFRELGVAKEPIDLSGMFEDKYRRFAVQYLGEYRPPR